MTKGAKKRAAPKTKKADPKGKTVKPRPAWVGTAFDDIAENSYFIATYVNNKGQVKQECAVWAENVHRAIKKLQSRQGIERSGWWRNFVSQQYGAKGATGFALCKIWEDIRATTATASGDLAFRIVQVKCFEIVQPVVDSCEDASDADEPREDASDAGEE